MKKIVLILAFLLPFFAAKAQDSITVCFAQRDTTNLFLDIYTPDQTPKACLVYTFGGGFMAGERNNPAVLPYFRELQKRGFMVVAFDYRLGLKGKKIHSMSIEPTENAIHLAVEDLYGAVRYLVDNQAKFGVDTSKIVLIGSSAGAITSLQADYMLCRRMPIADVLPESFRFAGVVAFSGAIFSREGKLNYLRQPAPTLFLHGTADKLVPYKQIEFFNIGFYGTNSIIKRFQKFSYPFQALRFAGHGHEIAALMTFDLEMSVAATVDFVDQYVLNRKSYQIDATIDGTDLPVPDWGSAKPSDLHKL